LVLAASVANLNLAVANVALPTIGKVFDTSQTVLNLIAVGYSLGLAASVLCLGAVGGLPEEGGGDQPRERVHRNRCAQSLGAARTRQHVARP
jgi:MFS family permease